MKKRLSYWHPVVLSLCLALSPLAFADSEDETNTEVIAVVESRPPIASDSAIGQSELDSELVAFVGHEHINQLLSFLPGAWISRGNGQEHLTALRSPVLTGGESCGAFLMLEDGIPLRAPGFCNVNQLFDVNSAQAQAIQVNLGPTYNQLGANVLHGTINTLTPSAMSITNQQIKIRGGGDQYQQLLLDLGQSGEDQGWRLLANNISDGGYQVDSGYDQQKLALIYQSQRGEWQQKSVLSLANLNQETAGFLPGFEAYKDRALVRDNAVPEAYRDAKSLRAYSKWQYNSTPESQLEITPYFRTNSMEFKLHFLPWQPIEQNEHTSFGLLLNQGTNLGSWNLGWNLNAEYTQGSLSEVQTAPFSDTIPAGSHYDFEVDSQHLSAALVAQKYLSDNLDLLAAWRFSYTRYAYDNLLEPGSACAPDVANCRFFRPDDETRSFNDQAPHLILNYRPNDDLQLYLRLARGVNQPQVNQLFRLQGQQTRANIDSETLDTIEIGVEGQGIHYDFRLALYSMRKQNFSFRDTQRFNVSEGNTSHRGLEFDFGFMPIEHFSTRLIGSYNLHRYTSDLTLSNENINGNLIDTAPRLIAKIYTAWNIPDFYQSKFALALNYTSEYFLDPENTTSYQGHETLDAFFDHQYNTHLFGNLKILNMTNRQYAERADFAFGDYRYFVGEPRSLFYTLTYLF